MEKDQKRKKKQKTPKLHNGDFSIQSIIDSVSTIGLGSVNDFDFNQKTTSLKSVQEIPTDLPSPSSDNENVTIEPSSNPLDVSTNANKTATAKRSKKINKAKLQKVFNSRMFKKRASTVKLMQGLVPFVRQANPNVSAKEIVTLLLIKWIIKEKPALETALLEVLDQHLNTK